MTIMSSPIDILHEISQSRSIQEPLRKVVILIPHCFPPLDNL